MRIGLIGHHAAPIALPFAGGVESMTWYLARWLADRGHDVTLFANRGSAVPGVTVIALQNEPGLSPEACHDVSMPAAGFMDAHRGYQTLMLDLIRAEHRFDVIHSHSLHYLPVLLAGLVDTPMALTLHCPPTPWLEAALADVGSAGPALVAVSSATQDLWSRTVPVPRVIRNGIDLARWQPGPGGDALLWAGRIVREKAPHLAIDAAARAGRSIRLAGPIADREYWDAEIAPRLTDRACYLGHLDHARLGRLVGASAALVVTPMWEEPFCLTAAEAVACGTPVAGFARGGLPEVVGRRGGVLTMPGDVGGLATAIELAIERPRADVRRHAEDTLGLDQAGRAHEDLYAELSVPMRARVRRARRRGLAWRLRPAPAGA
jgi:glycosyltransferase involved in cell wall biosynthesis